MMSSGDKPTSLRNSAAYASGIGRRLFEVQHVGNQNRRIALAHRQLLLRQRIDRHVLDRRRGGWKRHVQDVADGVHRKPGPLPVEVVMVGDRGNPGLGDEMRQGHAQRHVHRNAQGVLDDQNLDLESFHELVQRVLQVFALLVNPPRHFRRPREASEHALVDPDVVGMRKARFRHQHAGVGIAIQPAPVPEAGVLVVPQHLRPLGALQRNAVRARKAGRDEAHTTAHDGCAPRVTKSQLRRSVADRSDP